MASKVSAAGVRVLDQGAFDRHLKDFCESAPVLEYSQQFRREGYVKLPGLVSADLFAEVRDEVNGLLEQHAQRIDIELKETGNSPRKMHTVSAADIARDSRLITAIYDSVSIREV
ncbi:ArpA protein, partial [Streptomyces antioxidans]